ncbi:MAG TPA: hypothetical protein DHV55_01970 [Clostridiaceae bacterium]|nr:hypothetical protein [Clostridiaceae bacterium]
MKGLAGFIVGSIAHSGGAKGKSFMRNILAVIAGAALYKPISKLFL